MRSTRLFTVIASSAVVAVVAAAAAFAATSSNEPARSAASMRHAHPAASSAKAADLRVALNRLLGEHALLAIEATRAGYSGQKNYPATTRALDRNSVELSKAIGSIFGKQAGNKFLNGKLLWRDHIRFFVDYTVALAGKNTARQNQAVGNLRGYIEAFSGLLAGATGLPQSALRKSITAHVMQLKGQLDAYAKGQYARSYTLSRQAYHHMGMTGDVLAGAIVKKFPGKF